MTYTAQVSAKGRGVIPKAIRDRYGLKKGSRVRFADDGKEYDDDKDSFDRCR